MTNYKLTGDMRNLFLKSWENMVLEKLNKIGGGDKEWRFKVAEYVV